jgi:hypothetical protein
MAIPSYGGASRLRNFTYCSSWCNMLDSVSLGVFGWTA